MESMTPAIWTRFVDWIAAGEPARRADQRRQIRVRTRFDGVVSGPMGKISIRGVDLHQAGAGAEARNWLEPGSLVFLHLQTFQFVGFAHVRHCTRRGLLRYHVGLEFRSPLMRKDAGNWRFRQAEEAAGSREEWDRLMRSL